MHGNDRADLRVLWRVRVVGRGMLGTQHQVGGERVRHRADEERRHDADRTLGPILPEAGLPSHGDDARLNSALARSRSGPGQILVRRVEHDDAIAHRRSGTAVEQHGVPDLDFDCVGDPFAHEAIHVVERADIVVDHHLATEANRERPLFG